MANNVFDSPYADFLEKLIRDILELKPTKIGIAAILPDECCATTYFGKPCNTDKAVMAFMMEQDAIMDCVYANAKEIIAAAYDDTENEAGDE